MAFSFELNDRQSARVLEQAIRTSLAMRLDSQNGIEAEPLSVQLLADESERLTFSFAGGQAHLAERYLPGQYCQVQFALNGGIYMISVHIVAWDLAQERLWTSRPKMVQLLERRKFVRTSLAARSPVVLRWVDRDGLAEASLFNIGGGGLAFKISKDVGDSILVGDLMEAAFELPGLPRHLNFKISICNKTLASDGASVVVGAQFLEAPEDSQAGALDELRRFLATQQQANLAR
jgi:hypothetical protein